VVCIWARRDATRCCQEKKADRLRRARESQRWAAVFEETGGPGPAARWTYVADRESDIFEVFGRCQDKGIGFIIRANQPRALADQGGSIFEAVSKAPVYGRFSIDFRARPGQGARTAELEVRAKAVTVRGPWRPDGKLGPRRIMVVDAREVDGSKGVKPVHWVVLTSWRCRSFSEAMRVVKTYAKRWLIEEYHKALKTGAKVEKTQLETADRIGALLGVLGVVSVRLLNTKLLATTRPGQPVDAGELGPEALRILEARWGKPPEGWTYGSALVAIARLGGFLARKSDGDPGWLTIWRGWQRLMPLVQGFTLATGEKCG